MSGHTRGPWWISGKGTIRYGDKHAGDIRDGGWIADVHWRNREANARLIAAAPDLLEALETIVADMADDDAAATLNWGHAKDALETAREAIAKARQS